MNIPFTYEWIKFDLYSRSFSLSLVLSLESIFFLLSIKSLAKAWFRWFISWRIFYFIHSSNLLILLYYIILYLLILVLYCISVFVRLLFCIRIKLSIIIVWFWHKLQTFMNYFYVAPFQSGYHIIFSFLFNI